MPLPMPEFKTKDIRRFWLLVSKLGESQCWEWEGKKWKGYGTFHLRGHNYRAHRIAYFLHSAEDPGEAEVCHTCDNPPCCNPAHLFPGTREANAQDMMQKGRHKCGIGETHGSRTHPEKWYRGEQKIESKLTEEQVRTIRWEYAAATATHQELATRYGVKREAISAITQGKTWAHIAAEDGLGRISDPKRRGKPGSGNGAAKLGEDDVRTIRRLYRDGDHTYKTLAQQFGVSPGAVAFIIRRCTWANVSD